MKDQQHRIKERSSKEKLEAHKKIRNFCSFRNCGCWLDVWEWVQGFVGCCWLVSEEWFDQDFIGFKRIVVSAIIFGYVGFQFLLKEEEG